MKELIDRCLYFSIEINEHKKNNQTSEEYLLERNKFRPVINHIEPEVLQQIYNTNSFIELYCWSLIEDQPYLLFHYDYDLAIQQMLEILENER